MSSKGIGVRLYLILLGAVLISAVPAAAQESQTTKDMTRPRSCSKATSTRTVEYGKEIEFNGTIDRVDGDVIGVVDSGGVETAVLLQGSTKIRALGNGKFLHIKHNGSSADRGALVLGLPVEVEGHGNCANQIVAESIKFHNCCGCESRIEALLCPIQNELARQGDQLVETTGVASGALVAARNAQSAADKAQGTADKAQSTATAAQARIGALDDFEATESLIVNFKAGSAVLSDEAKAKLDEFAAKSANTKGYVIEIAGYASQEGTLSQNEALSARRAEAVVDYLVGTGKVPIRRLTIPYSGGISNPIADNSTREGREQNRRTEVRMLVSKGLAGSEAVSAEVRK